MNRDLPGGLAPTSLCIDYRIPDSSVNPHNANIFRPARKPSPGPHLIVMKQHTLKESTGTTGLALHSGQRVRVAMHPAPVDHGIVFVRTDVRHHPRVALGQARVCDTLLCTGIEHHGVRVRTIEHLLAALQGVGLDNLLIEVDAEELPILDGSAAPWIHLIMDAGLEEQDRFRKALQAMRYCRVNQGQSWIEVEPGETFRRTVEIDFDHPAIDRTPLIATNSGDMSEFLHHTARARTFGFLHQVEDMHSRGLAQGGSLDNAMVLDAHRLINEDGMRMDDEFAQHKLLDLMGDLMILGAPLLGCVRAYRPGHAVQAAFTQRLLKTPGIVRRVRITDHGVVPELSTAGRPALLLDQQPMQC